MAKRVTKQQLAALLGVTDRTLSRWQLEEPSLPIATIGAAGAENGYIVKDVVAWMCERAVRLAGAEDTRAQLARVQLEEARLRLQEKRGELVPSAEITEACGAVMDSVRAGVLQLPARVPMPEETRLALRREIDRILAELASNEIPRRGPRMESAGAPSNRGNPSPARPARKDAAQRVGGKISKAAAGISDPGSVPVRAHAVSAGDCRPIRGSKSASDRVSQERANRMD